MVTPPDPGEGRRAVVFTVLGVVLVTAFVARVGCARQSAATHRDAVDAAVCASATSDHPMALDAFAIEVREALRRAPGDLELRLIHAAASAPDDAALRQVVAHALVGDLGGARHAVIDATESGPPAQSAAWTRVLDRWATAIEAGCPDDVHDR